MKYKIVHDNNIELFENEVQSHINHGWVLQGGVSISVEPICIWYAQAICIIDPPILPNNPTPLP